MLARVRRYSAAASRDGAALFSSFLSALGGDCSCVSEVEENLAKSFEPNLSGDPEFGAKEAVADPRYCGKSPFAVADVIVPDKTAAIEAPLNGVVIRALSSKDCEFALKLSDEGSLRSKELV